MYFLELTFLLIVIHVQDKYLYFHIAKKHIIFVVIFPSKFLLCPFSLRIMLSCATVKTLFYSQYIFHKPKKQKNRAVVKKLNIFSYSDSEYLQLRKITLP